MTKQQELMLALQELMLEDIAAMSDEELLAEMRENGLNPTEIAQKLRMNALELIAKERKRRCCNST